MKLGKIILIPVLLGLTITPSFAAKKTATKSVTCPACHMALSTKKTASNPKSVKIGKKTYYCCAGCDMSGKKKK